MGITVAPGASLGHGQAGDEVADPGVVGDPGQLGVVEGAAGGLLGGGRRCSRLGDRLLRVVGGAADRAAGADGQVEGDLGGHPLEPGLADLEPALLEVLAAVDGRGVLDAGGVELGAEHDRTLVGGEPVGPLGDQPDQLVHPGRGSTGLLEAGGQAGDLDGEHGQPRGEPALLGHQVGLGGLVGGDPGGGRGHLGLSRQQGPGVGEQVAGRRLGDRQVAGCGVVQVEQPGRGDGGTQRRLAGPVALLPGGEGEPVQRGDGGGPAGQLEPGPAGRLGTGLAVEDTPLGARGVHPALLLAQLPAGVAGGGRRALVGRGPAPCGGRLRGGRRRGGRQVGGPVRERARAGDRGQVVVAPAVGQRRGGRLEQPADHPGDLAVPGLGAAVQLAGVLPQPALHVLEPLGAEQLLEQPVAFLGPGPQEGLEAALGQHRDLAELRHRHPDQAGDQVPGLVHPVGQRDPRLVDVLLEQHVGLLGGVAGAALLRALPGG